MITYKLVQNKVSTNPACYLKWYAHVVQGEALDMGALAAHMAAHNTPYSVGTILGILTDMVSCIKEELLAGNTVRIDNLAIFSVGIVNKKGCEDKADYKVTEYVEAVKMRALAIGELSRSSLNLDATLKRSSLDKDNTSSTSSSGSASGEGSSVTSGQEDLEG
jgi:predicted histone-like DNA-binding protein